MSRLPSSLFDLSHAPHAALTAPRLARQPSIFGPPVQDDEDEDRSLLESAITPVTSGLSAIGNILDLPGSVVRDILAGENPLDQLLGPSRWISSERKTSGRDLSRKLGLAGKENTWGNFLGGLAVEIGLDPMTYLTGGVGALTKAGAAAASKGALKKGVGAQIRAGQRGLIGARVPFTRGPSLSKPLFTGKKAAKIGDKLSETSTALRYSPPGRLAAQLFHAPSQTRKTALGQKYAGKQTREIQKRKAKGDIEVLHLAKTLEESGYSGDNLRAIVEGIEETPKELRPTVEAITKELEKLRLEREYLGSKSEVLKDEYAKYFPRYPGYEEIEVTLEGRKNLFKDFKEGSEGVNKVIGDVVIDKSIKELKEEGLKGAQLTDLVKHKLHERHPGAMKGEYTEFVEGKKKTVDRYQEVAKYMVDFPEKRASAIYTNHPMADLSRHVTAEGRRLAVANSTLDFLGAEARSGSEGVSVKNILNEANMNRTVGATRILERTNPELYGKLTKQAQATIEDFRDAMGREATGRRRRYKSYEPPGITRGLSPDEANALLRGSAGEKASMIEEKLLRKYRKKGATQLNKEINKILNKRIDQPLWDDFGHLFKKKKPAEPSKWESLLNPYDQFTRLFKIGVLSHPQRWNRDFLSAQARNMQVGMWTPDSLWNALKLKRGGTINDAHTWEPVKKWLIDNNRELTSEEGTRAVGILFGAHGPGRFREMTEGLAVGADRPATQLEGLLGVIPGRKKTNELKEMRSLFRTFFGREEGTKLVGRDPKTGKLRPGTIEGVLGAKDTTLGPVVAAERISKFSDDLTRLPPFLALLKKGWEPGEAMRRINKAQIDYRPEAFTPAEKHLKRLFPFYSFLTRNLGFTVKELAADPGGRMGQTVRAMGYVREGGDEGRDEELRMPDYVASKLAVPLKTLDDGTQRYLTGLGLMEEPALQFIGDPTKPRGTLMELLSALHPIPKAALEYTLDQSFFKRKPLSELDPPIGRTMANILGREEPVEWAGKYGPTLEHLASNMPTSRLLSTLRVATDPRKRETSGDVALNILNLLTGARITDVSPAVQRGILKKKLDATIREMGGREYPIHYFPEDEKLKMTPEEKVRAAQIEALSKILKAEGRKAKEEKEAQNQLEASGGPTLQSLLSPVS